MIKTLWIFALIAVLAFAAAWAADHPGNMILRWQGWEVQTSLALAGIVLAALFVGGLVILRLVAGLRGIPGSVAANLERRRRIKGLDVITAGLVAVAAGDAKQALKYAARLPKQDNAAPALAQLLGAQAAQLSGDEAAAEKYFQAMLADKQTEFLGLRGLLALATRRGQQQAALEYAERAFALASGAAWAFQAVLDAHMAAGHWRQALTTLDKGRKAGHIAPEPGQRLSAVLLTAEAQQVWDTDQQQARTLALKAFRLLPSFTPAALLAARATGAKEQKWKAAGILEEAWRAAPHPALVEAYSALEPQESAHARAKRLSGLAHMMPDHMESRLLLARLAMGTRDWPAARTALAPLVAHTPTARVCALMGEIEQEQSANVGAAREWLARAAFAPPEPQWVREGFDFDRQQWAALAHDLAAPDAVWPPRMDPALFARSGGPAPLKDIMPADHAPTDESEPSPSETSSPGEPSPASKPSPAVPLVLVEAPSAIDYTPIQNEPKEAAPHQPEHAATANDMPGPPPPPAHRLPPLRKTGRFTKPAKSLAKKARLPLVKDRGGEGTQKAPAVLRAPLPAPLYHGAPEDAPRPPDDPGPDYDAETL